MKPFPTHLQEPFEAFWQVFPRRPQDRPGKARAAFAKAVAAGVDPHFLARAAARYAAECKRLKSEPLFLPLVSTWLNDAGHESYPDPVERHLTIDKSASQDPLYDRLMAAGIEEASARAWFGHSQFAVEKRDGVPTLIVRAANKFVADTIRERWDAEVRQAWQVKRVIYDWPGGGKS
ncbi:hypothetical protein D3874_03125 [Oleomonas cavernae]|uniref:DnaA N-terminal domain-containing protein n=1 Tax=Oleomonas cavernae TaxID=2320859 RepID=A0A418WUA5_9PROT|nr:hypothetical protein [Oleomonas cavernae]RJF94821.1 hypothetical protein D3874_03125 [Oleomonas cavernae]